MSVDDVMLPANGASQALQVPMTTSRQVVMVVRGASGTRTYHVVLSRRGLDELTYFKGQGSQLRYEFGTRLAYDENTLVVGVPNDSSSGMGINADPNAGPVDQGRSQSGAVYIFVKSDDGVWAQEAYLKASNPDELDGFGASVALRGNTLAVGAPYDDRTATGQSSNLGSIESGAVYVFERTNSTWHESAYIKASNADAYDNFGSALAIDRQSLLVGAPGESSQATGVDGDLEDNSKVQSGAAYVFTHASDTWTQTTYLKASNTNQGARFGTSVAMLNDIIVIGADRDSNATAASGGADNDAKAVESGSVYVFSRSAAGWAQSAFLKASNYDTQEHFGEVLQLAENILVVSAPSEAGAGAGINPIKDDAMIDESGAAYVFVRDGDQWREQAYLKASQPYVKSFFGRSLMLLPHFLFVGAPGEASHAMGLDQDMNDMSTPGAGAVYIFSRLADAWSQLSYLKAPRSDSGYAFGFSLAASGEGGLFVGENGDASAATGLNGDLTDNSVPGFGATFFYP